MGWCIFQKQQVVMDRAGIVTEMMGGYLEQASHSFSSWFPKDRDLPRI